MAASRRVGGPRRAVWRLLISALALQVGVIPALAAEKTFVYALPGQPETLDSAKAESERSLHPMWLLCDALVNISRDGQRVEPGLAESWTESPDGLRVTFRLRSGAVFHDGSAVDAQAVKASFERQFHPWHELYTVTPPNTKEPLLQTLIEDIQISDRSTLVFKLKYPGLHYLSQVDIISPTAAARSAREFGRRPVCSGPFRLESWTRDRLVLLANDRYWGGRPRIDRVVFRFVDETASVVDWLIKGEADFMASLRDAVAFDRIRTSGRVSLVPVPALNVMYLGFYTDRPPFDRLTVRQAAAQAVDAPRTVQVLARGLGVPARGPLPPAVKSYDPTVSQLPHDTEAAKRLLARAGHASGLTVSLVHHAGDRLDTEIAVAIQSDLRRIGINVELLGKPSWGDVSAALRAKEGDMFIYSWHVRAPYPERILVPLFHSRSVGTTNFTRYTNQTVDRLLDEVVRLPDGLEQRRVYSQIQKQIVEDVPMVFLYHSTRLAAVGSRVQGLELNLGALPYDKLLKVDLAP